VATDTWKTVRVQSLPYFTVVSNQRSYPACFYHIKVNNYEYRSGSQINIFVESAVNVNLQIFGGRSLSNASIALNIGTNKTFKTGQVITVDAGTEAVLLVYAKDYRFNQVSFKFNYAVTGDQYPFYEKYFLGPDGMTWLIVAISVASFMALLIVVSIIIGIVYCCRRKDKVLPEPAKNGPGLANVSAAE
jgi:hypothetical protein